MTPRKGLAHRIVPLAVAVGVVAPVLVLIGAIGTKVGLFDWKVGFGVLTVGWAPKAAMVGVAVGLIALLLSFKDFRRLGLMALVAFLVPAITLGLFWKMRSIAQTVPPIHDVATSWDEPLGFSNEIMAARRTALNPVEADPRVPADSPAPWGGRRVAEINAETCPGAKPVRGGVDPDAAARALEAAGVQVTGRAPWRVEGTAESFWFGFKDDVVVRLRPEGTDVRSISRVGRSDLGANCKRVTKIVAALNG